MSNISPYDFKGHSLRVVQDDANSPWFVAKDVCIALGYDPQSINKITNKIPELHKGRKPIPTLGGVQKLLCVDEAGLNRLVLRSDKPEAEPFIEWVTAEVLPAIRKTGSYSMQPQVQPADPLAMAQQMLNELQNQRRDIVDLTQGQHRLDARIDKVQALAESKGRRKPPALSNQLPLDINPPALPKRAPGGGTNASPKPHTRSAHMRTVNGKRYPVRASQVRGHD